MNSIRKPLIASFLLMAAGVAAFCLPKPKYQGTEIISKINLPQTLAGWNAEDITDEYAQNQKNMNFIGHVLVREYDKDQGPLLYVFILDGDNFHHPKTCVGGAGFDAEDLPEMTFSVPHHTWKAKAVYFSKKDEGFLTLYWICIDKEEVGWGGQKLKTLWDALTQKKKTGVMVRIDITTTRELLGQAGQYAQELLTAIAAQIPASQQDYLFGK